jgi:lysophospholipase L1-like esterase
VVRLLPPLLAGAVLFGLGARSLAAVVVVVGSGVAVLALAWPRFARVLDRVVASLSRWVGHVLSFVMLGLLEVFVVAPVAGVAWLLRRDLLHVGATPAGSWASRGSPAADQVDRPFGHEGPPGRRGRLTRAAVVVPRVVGWVAIVIALDLLVGSLTRPGVEQIPLTERVAAATASQPWFDSYRGELESVEYTRDPFVLSEPVDRTGEHINLVDGHRVTELPAGVGADAPLVWVFGGSVAWGEGQRDAHTVPSELAALAAAGGTPVRVTNWAQRGDTAFVEAQRLERALAHEPEHPDLVVFLDGPDDVAVQAEHVTGNPSQYGLSLGEQTAASDGRSAWQRYQDTSVLFVLGQEVRGVFSTVPAGAQTGTTDASPGEATGVQSVRSGEIAAAAAQVYDRGRGLVSVVAEAADVPVLHVWVPVAASADANSTYRDAASRLAPGVVVLGPLGDAGGPVFLDGVHTNEAGARQVAEALYEQMAPALAELEGG